MKNAPYILIADDDSEDRYMLAASFDEIGHADTIKFSEDGCLLLKYLDTNVIEKIGLIVLDLNMPKLNGTETLRMIKNNPLYNNIPVIIFSTSVNEIEKTACMQLGARDYITKPNKWDGYINTCKKFYSISCEAAA